MLCGTNSKLQIASAIIYHCFKNMYVFFVNFSKPMDCTGYSWYAGKGVTERAAEKNLISQSKVPGSFVVVDSSNPYMDYKLLVL